MIFRGLNLGFLVYFLFFTMREFGLRLQDLDMILFDDYLLLTGMLFWWAVFCLINALYHLFFVKD